MMDDFEYAHAWWHRTAEDKKEAKAFVKEWNSMHGKEPVDVNEQ